MIEFALSFLLLVVCMSGVFQYGYTMFVYNGLEAAVTAAAVYASRATYDTRNSTFDTAVKNMAVYGNEAGTGTSLVPGLTTSNLAVVRTPASGFPQTVTLKISSLTVNAVFGSFIFSGKPNVSVAFSGEYFTSE